MGKREKERGGGLFFHTLKPKFSEKCEKQPHRGLNLTTRPGFSFSGSAAAFSSFLQTNSQTRKHSLVSI